MRYLILAYGDEKKCKALTEEQMRSLGKKCAARDEELRRTGKLRTQPLSYLAACTRCRQRGDH